MNSGKRNFCRRLPRTALAAMGLSLALCSLAAAEQLSLIDSSGATRSVHALPSGASATVHAQMVGKAGSKASLVLTDTESKNILRSEEVAANGQAKINGVTAGAYIISSSNDAVSIGSVSVNQGNEQVSRSSNDDGSMSNAVYVGGASAVLGGVGIAAASGAFSGDSSSSRTSASLSGVRTGGPGGPAQIGGGSVVMPSASSETSAFVVTSPPNAGTPVAAPAAGNVSVNTGPSYVSTPPNPGGTGGVTNVTPGPAPTPNSAPALSP